MVEIYSNDIKPSDQVNDNDNIKLYIPLCLGALVSSKHILTSKHCFGTEEVDIKVDPKTGVRTGSGKFIWKSHKGCTFKNFNFFSFLYIN